MTDVCSFAMRVAHACSGLSVKHRGKGGGVATGTAVAGFIYVRMVKILGKSMGQSQQNRAAIIFLTIILSITDSSNNRGSVAF